MTQLLKPEIQKKAQSLGFTQIKVDHLSSVFKKVKPDSSFFKQWINKGYHGEMSFLKNHPESRFQGENLLKTAQSICAFAIPYWTGPKIRGPRHQTQLPLSFPFQIARYARVPDYHRKIKKQLNHLGIWMQEQGWTEDFRICVDSAPILEKALGRSLNLGFIGKNTLLIQPTLGSYFFLAFLFLSSPLETISLARQKQYTFPDCGTCRRCLDVCPTQALEEPFLLNANKCLSYWTIEKRTAFSTSQINFSQNHLFGCDLCQEVCPYNSVTRDDVLFPDFQTTFSFENLISLENLIFMTQKDYTQWFGGTSLTRAKWYGLARNALILLFHLDRKKSRQVAFKRKQEEPFHEVIKQTCDQILAQ